MPNGGVPLHMVLHPRDGTETVVYCEGGRIRLYKRSDWDAGGRDATPSLELTEDEGRAIAWFLRYWLGERTLRPGYQMRPMVEAEFDF